jgi:hypothetical protein
VRSLNGAVSPQDCVEALATWRYILGAIFGRKTPSGQSWIAVLPKNYRSIVLTAIARASTPVVLLNRKSVLDFTDRGPLTQAGLAAARDFEIRDGDTPILGFHDHPKEMWVSQQFADLATSCEEKGWLQIEHLRSNSSLERTRER